MDEILPDIPITNKPQNRPPDYDWLQQRVPTYRPNSNASNAWPLTLFICLISFAISASYFKFSYMIAEEKILDYTDCAVNPMDISRPQILPFTTEGIDLREFRARKYRNPVPCSSTPCPGFENTEKPLAWSKPIQYLGDDPTHGFGLENIDFIIWMETAALPKFRKLYRKLNRNHSTFTNGLPKGQYRLRIEYNYPAKGYEARKKFIITKKGALGKGSNFFQMIGFLFFGIFYFCVTVVCILYRIFFKRNPQNSGIES